MSPWWRLRISFSADDFPRLSVSRIRSKRGSLLARSSTILSVPSVQPLATTMISAMTNSEGSSSVNKESSNVEIRRASLCAQIPMLTMFVKYHLQREIPLSSTTNCVLDFRLLPRQARSRGFRRFVCTSQRCDRSLPR